MATVTVWVVLAFCTFVQLMPSVLRWSVRVMVHTFPLPGRVPKALERSLSQIFVAASTRLSTIVLVIVVVELVFVLLVVLEGL